MPGYVGKLAPGQTLSARPYLAGSWREFARVRLEPGEERLFDAEAAEYSIVVISGEGTAQVSSRVEPFDAGASFTVGYRAQLRLTVAEQPVELFVTTLDIE